MRGNYILVFLAVVFFAVTAFGSVVLIGVREGASPSPITVALFAASILALILNRAVRNHRERHSASGKHP